MYSIERKINFLGNFVISSFQRTSWSMFTFEFVKLFSELIHQLLHNKQTFSEIRSCGILFLSIMFPK